MPFATYIIGTARFVHGQSLKCSYQQSKNVTRNSCAKYCIAISSGASVTGNGHIFWMLGKGHGQVTINCQRCYYTTSNLQLHLVCYCIQFMWLCLQIPLFSTYLVNPCSMPWGTKSKYNSTNRDSNTFQSFHIPSKSLQWFWRTSCNFISTTHPNQKSLTKAFIY